MRNLKTFLAELERQKLLVRIHAEVDSDQEIAEIHRRVIAAGGPALFFHRIRKSDFPVVTNLFGTSQRIDIAFGQEPIRFVDQAVQTVQQMGEPGLGKLLNAGRLLPRALHIGTRRPFLGQPRVMEKIMSGTDLNQLPITQSWREDGGAFLTLPLVYTEHPETHGHNLGIYRMQRYDASHLGMHWQIQKGGGFHYQVAEKQNRPLPVTVNLGGPPALMLAAVAPLPENVGELLLASFLQGRRLGITRIVGHPLPIVSECEFALLGEVAPHERRAEGPFGDHYGYYSLQHDYPVFHCKKICHAADAVFPATVVGKPRQEDFFIGEYLQRLLRPLFPLVMPGVQDLWSYGETGFHSLAAAVVRERYTREAMVSAFRILGEGQLSLTKFLLVLDRPQRLENFKSVLSFVLERAEFSRDLYIFGNLSMDSLDYTGPEVNKGSKGVLLGLGEPVRKLPEHWQGELPAPFTGAKAYCPGCLVVQGPGFSKDDQLCSRLAENVALRQWPMVVLVDDLKKTLASDAAFLWTTFTRFEPAADMHARNTTLERHHISYAEPVVIDARMKPRYPKELFCSPEIAEKVSRRWTEYFPQGMEQGSSDRGHL